MKTSLLPETTKNLLYFCPLTTSFSVAKSTWISSAAHHNSYINVFVIYLLIRELFNNKIHFFKFLSTNDKPWLDQLKFFTILPLNLWYKLLLKVPSVQGRGNTNKEGEMPCPKKNMKSQQPIKDTKISYSIASLVFRKFVFYLLKWSTPRYLKAQALQVPQKVRTVLVGYLLSGSHILVNSCTGSGISKNLLASWR